MGSQRSPFAALPSQEQRKGLRQGRSSAHPFPQPVQQNHLRNRIWGGIRGRGAGEKTQRRPPPYSFLPLELGVSSGLAGGWDVWVGLAHQGGSQGALCWIQPEVPSSSPLGCGHIQRASRGLAGSTEALVLWTPQENLGGCEVLCNAGRPRESSPKSVPAQLQPLSQHRFYPVPNSLDFPL